MNRFNLAQLFSSLVGAGARRAAERGADGSMAGAATTIRLSPEARTFFEAQAEVFGGASLSSVIAMTLEAVMRETKGAVDAPIDRNRRALDLMRDRFLHIHQVHGVDLTTLVELLGHRGFTMAALRDESELLNLLNDTVVDETAARFHVLRDWLLGRGPCTAEAGPWYKSPQNFCARVAELAADGRRPEVLCVRKEKAEFERAFSEGDNAPEEPVGFVIRCQIEGAARRSFATFELWEFERWNYEKCRLYFKALVRWLERAGSKRLVSWRGIELPAEVLRSMRSGDLLPVEAMEARTGGSVWYPEDYVDPPELSQVAKETSELPLVDSIYQECGLERFL